MGTTGVRDGKRRVGKIVARRGRVEWPDGTWNQPHSALTVLECGCCWKYECTLCGTLTGSGGGDEWGECGGDPPGKEYGDEKDCPHCTAEQDGRCVTCFEDLREFGCCHSEGPEGPEPDPDDCPMCRMSPSQAPADCPACGEPVYNDEAS